MTAPTSYSQAERHVRRFEEQHLQTSDAGRRLMASTQQIIVRHLPKPLKRFGPSITSALFDQPDLTRSLGPTLAEPRTGAHDRRRLFRSQPRHQTESSAHRLVVRTWKAGRLGLCAWL